LRRACPVSEVQAQRQRGEPALSRCWDRVETRNLMFAETRGFKTRRIAAERRSAGSGDPHPRCRGTVFCELLRRSRESPALALLLGTRGGRGSGAEALSHALD